MSITQLPFKAEGLSAKDKTPLKLPVGSTSERNSAPREGDTRANSQTNAVETFLNGRWISTPAGVTLANKKNISFSAQSFVFYPVDTSNGPLTASLPDAPKKGDVVKMVDYAGTWEDNYLTIARNGKKISNKEENITLDKEYGSIELMFIDDNVGWVITDSGKGLSEKISHITPNNTLLDQWVTYCVTVTATNRSVKLPANPLPGHRLSLIDYARNWETHGLVINPNGKKLEGKAEEIEVRDRNLHLELVYLDDTHGWDLVKSLSPKTVEMSQRLNANITAKVNSRYPVDTRNTSVTATLPASPRNGDMVSFFDDTNTWNKHDFVVNPGTKKVNGSLDALHYSRKHGEVTFLFSQASDSWHVINEKVGVHQVSDPKVANFTARPNESYFIQTTDGEVTVALPANPQLLDKIMLADSSNKWHINAAKVSGKIEGKDNVVVKLTANRGRASLVYMGEDTGWVFENLREVPWSKNITLPAKPTYFARHVIKTTKANESFTLPADAPDGTWFEVVPDITAELKFPFNVKVDGGQVAVYGEVTVSDASTGYRFVKSGPNYIASVMDFSDGYAGLRKAFNVNDDKHLLAGRSYDVTSRNKRITLTLPDGDTMESEGVISIYDAAGLAAAQNIRVKCAGTNTFSDGTSSQDIKTKFGYAEYRYMKNIRRWVQCGGTVQPSRDINYANSSGQELEAGKDYVINNVSAVPTVILPTVVAAGDTIRITEASRANSVSAFHIGRNGSKINNANDDMIVAEEGLTYNLQYVDASFGWQISTTKGTGQLHLAKTITSNTSTKAGFEYPVNAVQGPISVSLPNNPKNGDKVRFFDATGYASRNPLRIYGTTTKKINQVATNIYLNNDFGFIELTFSDVASSWIVSGKTDSPVLTKRVLTGNFTAKNNQVYLVDCTDGGMDITLPTESMPGDTVVIYDATEKWHSNPVTLRGDINGRNRDHDYRGKRGYVKVVSIGDGKWIDEFKHSGLSNVSTTATAAGTLLPANTVIALNHPDNGDSVKLPADPVVGDVVQLNPKVWEHTLLVDGNGNNILYWDEARSSVKIADNASVYVFTYEDGFWNLSITKRPEASSEGFINGGVLGNANSYIYPGYEYRIEDNVAREHDLHDYSDAIHDVEIKIVSNDGRNVRTALLSLESKGNCRFENGSTNINFGSGKVNIKLVLSQKDKIWRIEDNSFGDRLNIPRNVSVELASVVDINHLPKNKSGITYKVASSVPYGTVLRFSDVHGTFGPESNNGMVFTPGNGMTVDGSNSVELKEYKGYWEYMYVEGKDWKLIKGNKAKTLHAYDANNAPSKLYVTPALDALEINLNTNYTLSELVIKDGANSWDGQILFKQDATGNRQVTVPSNWRELRDSPGLALTPNSRTLMRVWYMNGEWLYSLKGDKGADTELPAPDNYNTWVGNYSISSQTYDPNTAQSEFELIFKTDGTFICKRISSSEGTDITEGVYTRSNRPATEYELKMVAGGTGHSSGEINQSRQWTKCGVTDLKYYVKVMAGPNEVEIDEVIRNIRVSLRKIAKPEWSLFEGMVNFTARAQTTLPTPPEGFNNWDNKTFEDSVNGRDPEPISVDVRAWFKANGDVVFSKKKHNSTRETLLTGTYVNQGRAATQYEFRVVPTVTNGTWHNPYSNWTALGTEDKLLTIGAGIPEKTTAHIHNRASFRIEIREIARPNAMKYSAVVVMGAEAQTTAPLTPPGFLGLFGKAYNHEHTVRDPEVAGSYIRTSFSSDGTFKIESREEGGDWAQLESGVFVLPGRSPNDYEYKFDVLSESNTRSSGHGHGIWHSMGSNSSTTVFVKLGPKKTGEKIGSREIKLMVREKARHNYLYEGNVSYGPKVTCTPPIKPPGYLDFNDETFTGTTVKLEPNPGEAYSKLLFKTNGMIEITTSNGAVQTYPFLLPGRTTDDMLISISQINAIGDSTLEMIGFPNPGSWLLPIGNSDKGLVVKNNMAVNQTGTIDGRRVFRITVRDTNDNSKDEIVYVILGAKVTIQPVVYPPTHNTWVGKEYLVTDVSRDPTKATAEAFITFKPDGTFKVGWDKGSNGTDGSWLEGTFVRPELTGRDYEILVSVGSGTGEVSAPPTSWTQVTTNLTLKVKSEVGPANCGTSLGDRVFNISIREKDFHGRNAEGSIRLKTKAQATAARPKPKYNEWNNTGPQINIDVPFTQSTWIKAIARFHPNGTYQIIEQRSGRAGVVKMTGNFVHEGRTGRNYRIKATRTKSVGNSRTSRNDLADWTAINGTKEISVYMPRGVDNTARHHFEEEFNILIEEVGGGNCNGVFTGKLRLLGSVISSYRRSYPVPLLWHGKNYARSLNTVRYGNNRVGIQWTFTVGVDGKLHISRYQLDPARNDNNDGQDFYQSSPFVANGLRANAYQFRIVRISGSNVGYGSWFNLSTLAASFGVTSMFTGNSVGNRLFGGHYRLEIREKAYPNSTLRTAVFRASARTICNRLELGQEWGEWKNKLYRYNLGTVPKGNGVYLAQIEVTGRSNKLLEVSNTRRTYTLNYAGAMPAGLPPSDMEYVIHRITRAVGFDGRTPTIYFAQVGRVENWGEVFKPSFHYSRRHVGNHSAYLDIDIEFRSKTYPAIKSRGILKFSWNWTIVDPLPHPNDMLTLPNGRTFSETRVGSTGASVVFDLQPGGDIIITDDEHHAFDWRTAGQSIDYQVRVDRISGDNRFTSTQPMGTWVSGSNYFKITVGALAEGYNESDRNQTTFRLHVRKARNHSVTAYRDFTLEAVSLGEREFPNPLGGRIGHGGENRVIREEER